MAPTISLSETPNVERFEQPHPAEVGFLVDAEQDRAWLEQFEIVADDQFLMDLQTLFDDDTDNLGLDDSTYSQSVAARNSFYDMIGLPYIEATDQNERINARTDLQNRCSTIAPLHTTVQTFRLMAGYKLDIPRIINAHPTAISYAPESVGAKIANFEELGLDAVKIINALPTAISYAPESVRAKVANFEELGLDYIKIINAHPTAIGLAPESVRAKVANFEELGLDAVKIINALPSAIGYAPESVRAKVANFEELGLDYIKIINALPSAIGYAPESVGAKIANFEELGLDYIKIINALPTAISYAPEKIANTVRLLKKAGKWQEISMEWNQGRKLSWLMLPVESMIIALGKSDEPETLTTNFKNTDTVKKYVKPIAISRKTRIAYVQERVGSLEVAKSSESNRAFANRLGAVMLLGLFKQSLVQKS